MVFDVDLCAQLCVSVARDQHQESSAVLSFLLLFLRQGFLPGLGSVARLADWWVPRICLSPSREVPGSQLCHRAQPLHECWGSELRSPSLASPSPHIHDLELMIFLLPLLGCYSCVPPGLIFAVLGSKPGLLVCWATTVS